jgi:hypothetical protein
MGSNKLSTFNTQATFLSSDDLQDLLLNNSNDSVYEIHLSLDPTSATDLAICKMARLSLIFNNP